MLQPVNVQVSSLNDPGGSPESFSEFRTRSYVGYTDQRGWQPAINIYEDESKYHICVELPGVRANEIDVRTEKGLLRIRGNRADPRPRPTDASLCVHLMEVQSGEYERQLRLPGNVDTERIEAAYREGFLWITLPKTNP